MTGSWRSVESRLVGDDSRFFLSAAVLLGSVGLLRGVRFPNLWSATQAQIDYSNGFVKRGLFGAVFTRPLHLNSYSHFALFSFGVLALVVLLFGLLALRSGMLQAIGKGAPLAIFTTSTACTAVGNMNGYLDCVFVAATLAVLLIRSPALRFVAAIFAGSFCAVMHEGFILLMLPVLLFSFLADAAAGRMRMARAITAVVVLGVVCVGVGGFAANAVPWTPARIALLQQTLANRVDFPVNPEFFNVLRLTTFNNFGLMVHGWYLQPHEIGAVASSIISYGPVLFALLLFAWRLCVASGNAVLLRSGFPLVLLLVSAPLAMHLLGYDYVRWWTFACIDAVLALMLLARALPHVHIAISSHGVRLAALLIALNLASGSYLLEAASPHTYPFLYDGLTALKHLHQGAGSYRPSQ